MFLPLRRLHTFANAIPCAENTYTWQTNAETQFKYHQLQEALPAQFRAPTALVGILL